MTTTESPTGASTSRFHKALRTAVIVLSIGMVLYHLVSTQYLIFSPFSHQNTHFGFAVLIIYLTTLIRAKKSWPVVVILLLASVVSVGYVAVFELDIQMRAGLINAADEVIGWILVVVALDACRRVFGPVLPAIALIGIVYTFFGHYLPGPFGIRVISPTYIVSHLSIGLSGMYGIALGVSANYIFLFIVFGALFQASGGLAFFMELGKVVGRRLRGGAADTAVVSSALIGSVTGSAVANVGITGAFTIPLMKKAGYKPYQAGAIEASASSVGQIMPPVMGAAGFLLAAMIGMPYVQVMAAAIVPALMFSFAIFCYCEFRARALNIVSEKIPIDKRLMLKVRFVYLAERVGIA